MDTDLNTYLAKGEYLPKFLRDFHDQKDVFKYLDRVQEKNIKLHRNEERHDSVNWRNAQIYTIDIFLWVMAKNGYTLQQCRRNLPFEDINESVYEDKLTYRDDYKALLKSAIKSP